MYAVYDRLEDPEEIARVGVLASCEFDNSCDLPITVYSLLLHEDGEDLATEVDDTDKEARATRHRRAVTEPGHLADVP